MTSTSFRIDPTIDRAQQGSSYCRCLSSDAGARTLREEKVC